MDHKRILFVDDELELLKIFKRYFEKEGFFVDTAPCGREAIDKLRGSDFDLLILDIKLPDMLGDEVVRRIRAEDNEIEIIMITGYPNLQDSIDLLEYRIHDILLKPISTQELLRVTIGALSPFFDSSSENPCQVVSPRS